MNNNHNLMVMMEIYSAVSLQTDNRWQQ